MFIKQANEGDETALSEIQELLDSSPTEGITALGGDLAQRAESILVERIAGEQLGFREGILAKLEMLRTELAGPRPTPIERLLVERVVACWLQVYHADAISSPLMAHLLSFDVGSDLSAVEQSHGFTCV